MIYFKWKCIFFVSIFILISCITNKDKNNLLIEVDSQLLRMPYEELSFIYPDSSIRLQRKVASDFFIPKEITQFITSKNDEPKKNILEAQKQTYLAIPSPLDVVASSIEDLRRGDFQKAIEKNKSILNVLERNRTKTLDEDYSVSPFRESSLVLALAYLQGGNEENALPILEKLVINSSHWTPVYIALSDYYFSKQAFSLSLDIASRGVDLCTEPTPLLYVFQARAYRSLGNKVAARQSLNRAKHLFSENNTVYLWFGVLDYDEKNYSSACEYFKKAYELDKINPNNAHNYTYCLIQEKQYELANNILQVALANYPSHAHLYYLNGVLENLRKNYFAAQKSWQTYLSLINESDPNYQTILFKIEQMGLNGKTLYNEQYFPYPEEAIKTN